MDRPRRRPAATLRLTPFEAPPAGARWTPASSTLSGATPSTTKAFALLGLLNGARHNGRTLWTGDSFGQWLLHKPRRARWMGSKHGFRIGQRLRHATAVRPDAVAASPSRGDL